MQGEILNRFVQSFVDEPDKYASGDEQIIVLIESPSESDLRGRNILTDNLTQDVENHFYHVVELCKGDGKYNLTAEEFFKIPNAYNPVDVLLENMGDRVEDCQQIQIIAKSHTADHDISYMDKVSGRKTFSDLSAYYLFVVRWPKDDTTSATARGHNLGDYIKQKLTV